MLKYDLEKYLYILSDAWADDDRDYDLDQTLSHLTGPHVAAMELVMRRVAEQEASYADERQYERLLTGLVSPHRT